MVRFGDVVHRQTGPWAGTVHSLLRHLEASGFEGSPRVVGSGFDEEGRETVSYIPGEVIHPHPWTDEALPVLGALLRGLHDATDSFTPPDDAIWRGWFGRRLGQERKIIGHCDVGPWNIIARDGMPVALIDWEVAGPVDRLFELAQACWLNAQLHDDDVAEMCGLPSLERRAQQTKAILDGYGLGKKDRIGFVDIMIELAVCDAASQAREAGVTAESEDTASLWAITWRTRAAAWMLKNRSILKQTIEG